jgi:hypothetical protein
MIPRDNIYSDKPIRKLEFLIKKLLRETEKAIKEEASPESDLYKLRFLAPTKNEPYFLKVLDTSLVCLCYDLMNDYIFTVQFTLYFPVSSSPNKSSFSIRFSLKDIEFFVAIEDVIVHKLLTALATLFSEMRMFAGTKMNVYSFMNKIEGPVLQFAKKQHWNIGSLR